MKPLRIVSVLALLAGVAQAADAPPPVPVVVTTARSEKLGAILSATGS
jgi:hypothetical protein